MSSIKADIVLLGDKGDQTLQSVHNYQEKREKNLKNEFNEVYLLLDKIEKLMMEICNELGENHITGKQISRYTYNDIFESMFLCKNFNKDNEIGQKILSRLHSFEYDNYDLISAYIQKISGEKVDYNIIDIKHDEWEGRNYMLKHSSHQMI